jgi:hypothetical protein
LLTKDVIVVSGPTGCGKTFIIKHLLGELGINFFEYDWLLFGRQDYISNFVKKTPFPSLVFKNPMNARINDLDDDQFILVDNADGFDLENIKKLIFESFRVILIFNNPNISLGKEIESELNPDSYEFIELNAVTQSNIKKLTDRFVSKAVSDAISKCCEGDLRRALLMCYEHSMFGAVGNYGVYKLEFFHSLGKILYPRKNPIVQWPLVDHEPEDFFIFNRYLQFNCLEFFLSDSENLCTVMDSFSLAIPHSEHVCEYSSRLIGYLVNQPDHHRSQKKTFGFRGPPSFYF